MERVIKKKKSESGNEALVLLQEWVSNFCKTVTDAWPSVPQIRKEIESTPQYETLKSLGVPQSGNWKGMSLEDVENWFIRSVCSKIEETWAEKEGHYLPSEAELISKHSAVAKNCTMDTNEYVPHFAKDHLPIQTKSFYRNPSDFNVWFYRNLQSKINSSLYNDNRVYSLEELETLIPNIDSPHFSREGIMLQYLYDMKSLKPRGKDWDDKITLLQEIVAMK